MTKFEIRRALAADVPRLVEIWTEQRDIEAQLDPRLGLDVVGVPVEGVRSALTDPAARVFVALADGVVVGFVWAWQVAGVGGVRVLAVDAHDGGGGVGTVLLDAATGWLREAGAGHLIVENVPRYVAVQHAFWRAKGAGVIRETLYLPIPVGDETRADGDA